MKQRYIRNLTPIMIVEFDGNPRLRRRGDRGEPMLISVWHFVASRLYDAIFGQSLETVTACAAIRDAGARLAPEDEYLVLDEFEWELLAQAVRTPSAGAQYDPAVAVCLLPFMKAILEASTELQTASAREPTDEASAN